MKERTHFEQTTLRLKGFTSSSGLEIEIPEPEGNRIPPPQKKEGVRGGRQQKSRGTTGPEEEPVPVNKH
jgi:hypothetical protein